MSPLLFQQLYGAPLTRGADVRVDLRRGHRLVAEQIADVSNVRAPLQELGRIAVPEHVRMDVLPQPPRQPLHGLGDDPMRDALAARRDEQRVFRAAALALLQIGIQGRAGGRRKPITRSLFPLPLT